MTEYAFDLYPRSNPKNGSRLARFTYSDLISAEYRDVIGVGSGSALLSIDHDGAEHIDRRGEQYIRVVRLGGTEKVLGGIWTSKLPFETAVAKETRRLTLSGPGQMAYLARARLAPHSYLNNTSVGVPGHDPYDGMIRFHEQGPLAGGDKAGAILWRAIADFGSGLRSGTYTHVHKTPEEFGQIITDSHADDRTVNRIPDLSLGFDPFQDSDGNAWTIPSGEFSAQVGENLLGVVQRLMQAGLFVWMDPDTFTLHAWEGRPATRLGRSTDRTGGSWGSSVVRFQSPTDDTVATGNILSDATRVVNAYLPQGPIWVGGNDVYHKQTGASDALYEGFVHSTVIESDALAAIGQAQSNAREEAADVGQLRIRVGDDPANGAYLLGEHIRLDELVRINTGDGEFDYDEADYPVAAWRISLAANDADWQGFVELGASFDEAARREFAVPSTPGHTHPPNPELCPPTLPGSDATRLTGTYGAVSPDIGHDPADLGDGDHDTFCGSRPFSNAEFHFDAGSSVSVSSWRVVQRGADPGQTRAPQISLQYNSHATDHNLGTWTTLDTTVDACTDSGVRAVTPTSARFWRMLNNFIQCTSGLSFSWRVAEWYLFTGGSTDAENPHAGNSRFAARCDHTHPAEEHEHDGVAPVNHDHLLAGLDDVDIPTEPDDGDVVAWDAGGQKFTAQPPGGGGSGMTNPMTTAGDIITGGSGGTPQRVGIGSAGQVLKVVSGAPAWAAESGGGGGGGGTYPGESLYPLDIPPGSPHAGDDEFDDASLDGKWTQITSDSSGATTATEANGWLEIVSSTSGTGSLGARGPIGYRQNSPSGSFQILARIINGQGSEGGGGQGRAGIFVGRTASSRFILWGNSIAVGPRIKEYFISTGGYSESAQWGAINTTANNAVNRFGELHGLWYRIRWNASTSQIFLDWSSNGYSWFNEYTLASELQPDRMGFCVYSDGTVLAADHRMRIGWFRVVESAAYRP